MSCLPERQAAGVLADLFCGQTSQWKSALPQWESYYNGVKHTSPPRISKLSTDKLQLREKRPK